jgi:hypothetical protein
MKGAGFMEKYLRHINDNIFVDENGELVAVYDPGTHFIRNKESSKALQKIKDYYVDDPFLKKHFIAGYHSPVREISNKLNFEQLGALMVLLSHLELDSDGFLMNGERKSYLTQVDIQKELGKSRRQTIRILNALVDAEVLIKQTRSGRNVFKVNPEFHSMGAVDNDKHYTKIIKNTLKGKLKLLYSVEADQLNLTQIGLLYKMMPFFHYNKFWLVHNPNEDDFDKIIPMNQEDLAETLGIAVRNLRPHLNALFRSGVMFRIGSYGGYIYGINPELYYRRSKETPETIAYRNAMIEQVQLTKKSAMRQKRKAVRKERQAKDFQ